jgi:hypothetical protein
MKKEKEKENCRRRNRYTMSHLAFDISPVGVSLERGCKIEGLAADGADLIVGTSQGSVLRFKIDSSGALSQRGCLRPETLSPSLRAARRSATPRRPLF